ncbi:MAG: PAS domain S-box protein [Candidatus Aminicenantes bacterium]|nr:PAS domain S-box protein [Candidatus Aminicenantes bacterium]
MVKDEKFKNLNRKAEGRLKKLKKKQKDSMIDTEELLHESQVHQINLEMRKEELRDRQLDYLAGIIETSPVCIIHVDAAGRIQFANPKAEEVLRLSKSEISNREYNDPQWQITDFDGHPFPDEELPFVQVRKSLRPVFDIRHAIRHLDGSSTFLSINAAPLFDQDKAFNGMVATIEDVTQIHLARRELRRKASEVEQLSEISIPLVLISRNFEILRANNAFCRTFQVRKDDIVGKMCHEIWQGPRCKTDNCLLKLALAAKEPDSYEVQRELPDKTRMDILVQAKPYRDEAGNITGIVETFTDISKEKQSTEQIETIWNVSHDLLCVADYHNATFIKVNPAFQTILGYSEAELLSRPFLDFVHPDDVQPTIGVIEKKLKQGETVIDFTNRYRARDGGYRHLQWISRPIPERGETYAIARDITEQKKQAEELQLKTEEIDTMNEELQSQNEELSEFLEQIKESEETYRNLFQNAQVGLFRTRIKDGKILESNEQMAEMFGYDSREKFVSEYRTVGNYVDAGTREKMLEQIRENGHIHNFEARFYRRDRSVFWARYSARLYPDKGWIEGVAEDITEYKQAEISLQKEKDWSESIIENAPNIVVGLGEKSEIKVFNKYAEKLTGYKAEEVIGKEWIELFIPEEQRMAINRVWDEIVKNKLIDHQFENEILTRSGEKRLIEWSNTILSDDGDFRMILSLGEDITERRQAREQLRRSEEKFKSVFESSNAGKSITLLTGEINVNKAFCDMLGYSPAELQNKKWQDITPPDEVESTEKLIESLLKGEMDSTRFEKRYIHRNGSIVWADVSVAIVRDAEGEPLYFLTTVVDITERKRAEERLRESERQYAILTESAFELVELTSIQNIYEYAAGKLRELMQGMGIVGIVEYDTGSNLWKMKHIEGVDEKYVELSKIFGFDIRKMEGEISTKYYEKILSGKLEEIEFDFPGLFNNRVSDKIGKTVKNMLSIGKMYCIAFQENERILGNITLVTKKNAKPLNSKLIESFVLQVTNFVKRKKSDEALQASETKFRTLMDQASEMLFLHDLEGNLVEVNQTAIKSTGYSRAELEQMNVLDIDPDAHDRDDMHTFWLAMIPDDPPVTIQGRHKRKDGSIYPAEITLSKIAYSGTQYILGLARDITQRKEAENALRKVKNSLEIQVREKTKELRERVAELERFHDATIEREFRIKELRSEIDRLKAEKSE